MRKLTVLRESAYSLESPCHESFEAMPARSDGRYCGSCRRTVVDLTSLSRREAAALFEKSGGDLCGVVQADASGTIYFPERIQPPGRVAAAALVSLLAVGCGSSVDGAPSVLPPLPSPVPTASAQAYPLSVVGPKQVHPAPSPTPLAEPGVAPPVAPSTDAGVPARPDARVVEHRMGRMRVRDDGF